MRYDAFQYLWPPRPVNAVPHNLLAFFERKGYEAQVKMNGTCNVMAVSPDKQIVAMNRHNEPHRAWAPTAASGAAFRDLPGKGWYVFVAELLHSKVEGIRDTNYVHDVLVLDGEYLIHKPLAERRDALFGLFHRKGQAETVSHFVVNDNTWLAKGHPAGTNFAKLFHSLDRPEHEGLVLKSPTAPLDFCSRQSANANWQVKCRRPTKNYGF